MAVATETAAERAATIIHNLAGMDHEAQANFLLHTVPADELLAAAEHLENARRRGPDIYDEWGFLTKVSLPEVRGEAKKQPKSSSRPGDDTKLGVDRWKSLLSAHEHNVEAAAREYLAGVLSQLAEAGKVPVEYRMWATYVSWAPNSDRVVTLNWQGKEVTRRLKAGQYLIAIEAIDRVLREIGQSAWAEWLDSALHTTEV